MGTHTVEKIGGTSMSCVQEVVDNIFVGKRSGNDLYQRVFVVSAYGGMTDQLLEHKKSSEPGVYGLFSSTESEWAWGDAITRVCQSMCEINADIFEDEVDLQQADHFVKERIEGVRSCLIDLHRICSFGHFQLDEHLLTVREMLSALGEAHSAFNTTLLLQKKGVNARFVDLSGWREQDNMPLDDKIRQAFSTIDLSRELPIVTGYAQCKEGLMRTFDRGYSEITFSRIAVITEAREAIIHKEYHLSTADPKMVGEDRVKPIGRTNYDVTDQLSNLGMEAIHPRAAKGLRQQEIPLRVKNTFEPEHKGTLIDSDYKSEVPCVEIIAGRQGVYAIQFFDQDMVGSSGYEEAVLEELRRFKVKTVSKDINANTLTHYVAVPMKSVKRIVDALQKRFPSADLTVRKVAIVSAIGSDMQVQGILARAVTSLAQQGINILAVHQSMRQVDMQFVVEESDYRAAVSGLHQELLEQAPDQQAA